MSIRRWSSPRRPRSKPRSSISNTATSTRRLTARAGARLVDVGNVVQANSTSLLSIQRLDPIYANFTITESDLPAVQKQMSRGGLKAAVRLPSDPESAARIGRIEFLDNSVQNGAARSTCAPRSATLTATSGPASLST